MNPVDAVAKFHFNEGVSYSLQSETQASQLNFKNSIELASHAVREYELALQIDPLHLVILQTKGVALRQQGQFLEAAEIFERLIESTRDQPENYYQLSLCFFEHNLYEPGLETFKEALEIFNTPTWVTRLCSDLATIALKWVYFAHDCLNMGQTEAFEHIAKEVIAIVDIGLQFDPANTFFNQIQDQILTDIRHVKNAQ